MEQSFSIGESLRFGWHTLKSHSRLIYQILFTVLGAQVAYAMVTKVLAGTALGFIAATVLFVAELVFSVGVTLVSLKLARHEHATYNNLVPAAALVLRYIGASILAGLIVLIPIFIALLVAAFLFTLAGTTVAIAGAVFVGILAAVACITLALRYFFVKLAVVDGAGITGSLYKSAQMTEGHKWHLLGFLCVFALLNILGAVLFLVGLLVSVPVTMLAYAHIYTKLAR